MSTTIDQRVVEMQFDNKQFESNVKTTMSTLDKLKQSLNLKGASKGLEEVNAAAKKVNLNPLADSTNVVVERFSIMGSAVNRVIENMVDQAFAAGKRIVSALTIDPISTGLSEYETKVNAIQVIKANTRTQFSSETEQMEAINKALADLNDYADRTIYNFAQMTDNVGKFVAQGLEVEEAANAVQGLANLAGASGASAQDMARATYQMSQALGGIIRKIDWNSLRNANMASVELKNTLMDIARVRGIDIDGMIAEKGIFEDTLEEGWLTGELFTEAMNIYSDVYSEAELKAKGFTDAQVKNFKALAKTAREATTEVKTVSQLWDVLKETAQSGWTQSWELIFGDFNTAKKTFTELQVYFSDILNRWSEVRNTILGGVFNIKTPWEAITEKLEASGLGKIVEIGEKISDVTHKLEDFQDIVSKVWRGDYGNADTGRFEKLTELGWDHRVVQDLVNKGLDYKLTMDDVEESHKKFGLTLDKTSDSVKNMIDPLAGLTDAQLRNAGLTETEINLYRDLEKEAARTGVTISELVDKMSKNDGRTLMIESFKNAWSGLVSIFKAVKYAWQDIFPPVSVVRLYSIIEGIKEFTEKLIPAPHTVGLLTRSFKGLFAALDIVSTLLAGPLKIGFKILQQFLAAFDLDILSATAKLGDAIVKFRDWIDASLDFTAVFEKIAPTVTNVAESLNDFIKSIKDSIPSLKEFAQSYQKWCDGVEGYEDLPKKIGEAIGKGLAKVLQNIGKTIATIIKKIVSVITGIPMEASDEVSSGAEGLGRNIITGIVTGLANGIKFIVEAIIEVGRTLISSFADVIDSHSPSRVFMAFGGFIIAGLILGILTNIPSIVEALKTVGSFIAENFGDIVSTISSKIMGFFDKIGINASKFTTILSSIMTFIPGLGFGKYITAIVNFARVTGDNVSTGFEKAATGTKTAASKFGDALSTAFDFIKEKLTNFVVFLRDNIGSIVAIIGGIMITKVVLKLAEVVEGLTSVVSKISGAISGMFSSFGKAAELIGKGVFIFFLALAIGKLAEAFVMLADLSWPDISKGAAVIGGLAVVVTGIALAVGLLSKKMDSVDSKTIIGVAATMISLAVAVGILVYALTKMDEIDGDRIWQHVAVIGVLALGMAGVAAIMSKVKGEVTKGSLAMIAIAAAILILVFALTKLNALVIDDPVKTIGALITIAAGLALVALMSKGINKGAALGMLGMILSIYLFTKLLERMAKSKERLEEGVGTIIFILGLFAGLMLATRLISWDSGNDMAKVCAGIFMLSLALVVVVAAMRMLAKMDASGIEQSLKVVTVVMLLFSLMIGMSKFAGEHAMRAGVMLIMMSTAMLILVGAIWLLSLIGKNNAEGLKQAVAVVSILMVLFGMLIYVSKFAQKSMGAVIAITAAIGILVIAVGALSILAKDPTSLWQAVAALSVIMLVLAALITSLKFVQNGKSAFAVVGTLIVLAGIIVILGHCINELAKLDPKNALGAAGALSMVMLALAGSLKIMNGFRKQKPEALLKTILAMLIALGAVALILKLLDGIDPVGALANAAALSILALALSKSITIMSSYRKQKPESLFKTMLAMVIVVGAFALILHALDGIDPVGALANAAALSILLNALASACLILSQSKKIKDGAITAAFAMVAVLAVIAIIIGLMAHWNLEASINNAVSLSVLLNALASACLILSQSKKIKSGVIKSALAMSAVLVVIAGVLGLMAHWNLEGSVNNAIALSIVLNALASSCLILSQSKKIKDGAITAAFAMSAVLVVIAGVLSLMAHWNLEASINNAIALSTLLMALSVACLILSGVQRVNWGAIAAVAVLGLIMLELGWVLSVILKMNIGPCLGIVVSLSVFLIAMSIVTGILALVGGAAPTAIIGAVGLMGVIAILGLVAMAIGALMDLIPPSVVERWKVGLESFMEFIIILAKGLGEAVGAFITGTLGGIGKGLSDFMIGLQGFIDGAKQIDMSVAEGMKALAAAILAITAASILDGLAKLLGLGTMESLGASLASFGESMIAFAKSISDLTEEDINRIKMASEAGKAMAEMESSVPRQGGWWQEIAGSTDMADFGVRMEAFGASLVAFSNSIVDLTEDDINRISMAASAGTAMAKMEKAVPKQGGWWQTIAGEKDMEAFGLRMEAFGKSLIKYAKSIAGLTEEDAANIENSAKVGTAMADLEDSVPRQDGWWQDIAGEKDIETFGSRMEAFGQSIVDYSKIVSKLDSGAKEDIEKSKAAAKALVDVYDTLPKDSGWWGSIAGERDPSTLGTGMYDLAKGLAKYASAAAGLDENAVDNITNSKDAVKALVDVADAIPREGGWGEAIIGSVNAQSFGAGMITLASSLKEYSAAVSEGIDTTKIEESKAAIIAMADAAKALPNEGGLAGLLAGENSDISGFGSKMVGLAKQVMTYADTVSDITEEDVAAIDASRFAIVAMAGAAKALPNEGGVAGWLAGENSDFAGFGAKMVELAKHVMSYAGVVLDITEEDIMAINRSKFAIIAMTDAAKSMPNEGGVAGWLAGENSDIVGFGTKMISLATALKTYMAMVVDIDEAGIKAIEVSGMGISKLAEVAVMATMFNGVELTDLTMTSANLVKIANMLSQYIPKVMGITEESIVAIRTSGDAIYALAGVASKATALNGFETAVSDAAINQLTKLVNLAKGMSGVNFASMDAFAESFDKLGNISVQKFVDAFANSYDRVSAAGAKMVDNLYQSIVARSGQVTVAITMITTQMVMAINKSTVLFRTSGMTLMLEFANGILTGSTLVMTTMTTVVSSAASAIKAQRSEWFYAGTDLVNGFASGISERTWFAKAKAVAMATAALNAAKEALKINSPSKEFIKIGKSVPEGFAMGIGMLGTVVDNSVESMGANALKGTKNIIAKLASYVETDVDSQPTIRPVLDLSDVNSGINQLNGMFNMTPSVGVLSNVGAISSMMNTNQNGTNDDIISAIRDLGDALSTSGGDTYQINGITYDDDSVVTEAIRTIARHARMERRV